MTDIDTQQWQHQAQQATLACSHARITLQFLIMREPRIAELYSVQYALDALNNVLGSHRP